MIDRLKSQQEKLIINERHEAWGSLARKLAHEIKNPLTPIQLTIDRLKNKYSKQLNENETENFKNNLKVINNQIKQIQKLVNEFSDFARMPKSIFRENNLVDIIQENINLLKELDNSIDINFKKVTKKFIPKNNFQYQWVKVSDVENIALPKPIKKIIKNHGKENPL